MCERRYNFGRLSYNWHKTNKRDYYCRSRSSVMEFESNLTKHRKSSATSCMPWSCRIPIGE